MKKAIGFLGGQFGDAITTIAAQKIFLEHNPDFEFTFALSKKYEEIIPLFLNQPHIKNVHLWEGYDSYWPTTNDLEFINNQKFDIVFNPMQGVIHDWFKSMHQVSLCCARYGLKIPKTNEVSLHKYFEPNENYKNYVAVSYFANNGQGIKNISIQKINIINNFIKNMGYKIVHLGGCNEPIIDHAINPKLSLFESVRILCSCKLLITTDTAMSWIASAYKIPTIGIYSYAYHPGATTSINWQPVNPNAFYLDSDAAENVSLNDILENIEKKLKE